MSNASFSPPTINVNVPFSAPTTPPDTGESITTMEFFLASLDTCKALSTSTVEQSTSIVLSLHKGMSSSYTFLKIFPSGNIEKIILHSSAILATVSWVISPTFFGITSKPNKS